MPPKFKVGDVVTLKPSVVQNVPGGIYEVIKVLPDHNGEREYRIKSANELLRVAVPASLGNPATEYGQALPVGMFRLFEVSKPRAAACRIAADKHRPVVRTFTRAELHMYCRVAFLLGRS